MSLTVLILATSLVAGQAEDSLDPTEIATKLKKVQAERIETLERAIELANAQYRNGLLDIGVLLEMQPDLIDAKLDVAESLEEQIRVLKAQLKIANTVHALARAKFEAGMSPSYEFIRAKAAALRIEVELLKRQHALATR